MSMSDPLANMLAAIKNGQLARLSTVTCPSSRLRIGALEVLKKEGFIRAYQENEERKGVKRLTIELKYDEGKPVIKEMKRISTPGRRVYSSIQNLPRIHNGLGISVLSTSKGVMSNFDAGQNKVGGEVLFSVF